LRRDAAPPPPPPRRRPSQAPRRLLRHHLAPPRAPRSRPRLHPRPRPHAAGEATARRPRAPLHPPRIRPARAAAEGHARARPRPRARAARGWESLRPHAPPRDAVPPRPPRRAPLPRGQRRAPLPPRPHVDAPRPRRRLHPGRRHRPRRLHQLRGARRRRRRLRPPHHPRGARPRHRPPVRRRLSLRPRRGEPRPPARGPGRARLEREPHPHLPRTPRGMSAHQPIRALLEEGVSQRIFPAAQAAVFRDGQLAFSAAAGAASDSTLFDLGSLTKICCTTAAFVTLWSEGSLAPDTPLSRFFPRSPASQAGVTLADLLYHRSGLPAFVPYFAKVMPAVPALFDPRCPAA